LTEAAQYECSFHRTAHHATGLVLASDKWKDKIKDIQHIGHNTGRNVYNHVAVDKVVTLAAVCHVSGIKQYVTCKRRRVAVALHGHILTPWMKC